MVELIDDGVEFGFFGGEGLVEGGDFLVEGDDAVAERVLGGGAEGEEEFEEAGGVEGFGDVHGAEGVSPLGGGEGEMEAVVVTEDFAPGDVEGEFVVGVGDDEGGSGLEQGIEDIEASLEGFGVAFFGPGGEGAALESGGDFGGFLPCGGGADVRPEAVGLEGDRGGLGAVKALVELGDGVAAEGVEFLQLAGTIADFLALLGGRIGDGEWGNELFVSFVVAAFFVLRCASENKVANRRVQDAEQIPSDIRA